MWLLMPGNSTQRRLPLANADLTMWLILVYLENLSRLSVSSVTWMRASSCARAQLQVGHLKPCDDKHALASAAGKSCMGCAWSECSDNFQGSDQTLPKLRRVV